MQGGEVSPTISSQYGSTSCSSSDSFPGKKVMLPHWWACWEAAPCSFLRLCPATCKNSRPFLTEITVTTLTWFNPSFKEIISWKTYYVCFAVIYVYKTYLCDLKGLQSPVRVSRLSDQSVQQNNDSPKTSHQCGIFFIFPKVSRNTMFTRCLSTWLWDTAIYLRKYNSDTLY